MFSKYISRYRASKMYRRGMEYLLRREYRKAIDEFEEASKLDPADDMIFLNLGQAYAEIDEFDKAVENLKKARELASPVNPVPDIYLGYAYYRAGRLPEAGAALEAALKIDIKHPAAHYYLGLVCLKKGKLEEATEHFEEVASEKPTFIQARLLAIGELLADRRENNVSDMTKKEKID